MRTGSQYPKAAWSFLVKDVKIVEFVSHVALHAYMPYADLSKTFLLATWLLLLNGKKRVATSTTQS